MTPSIAVAMSHDQTMSFGGFFEALVVVGVTSTAILNAVCVVIVMAHFVKECRANILNRSCKRSCSNVDFMSFPILGNPSVISQGEVTICFRCALNGDRRS